MLTGFPVSCDGLESDREIGSERVVETLLKGLTGLIAHVCRQKYHEKTESV